MTAAQTLKSFLVCCDITRMYLPIFLVRLDERTGNVFILAGEEIEVVIDRNGEFVKNDETEF
ncbi:hypothetical protein ACE1CD_16145 [Aerosakkonema sp. BLCC-F183]|uniref:DUF6888 family protein n=1 Tax=Aerosakkonema sp. BLCC-F183 TaxID=3342834 RepID=UPI0035B8A258